MNEGRLEASSEALTWVARAGDKNVKLPLSAAKAVSFYDMGRACQLWLTDQKGVMHRFDGFRLADYDRLASFFSGVGLTLAKRELSAKGRNWGSMRINGAQLELLDDSGKLVAPIPLNAVSQAALPGKGEVEIQFFDDDAVEREDEAVIEMRLYVPEGHALPGVDMDAAASAAKEKARAKAAKHKKRASAAGGSAEDEDGEDGEGDLPAGAGEGAAAVVHSLVTDAAGIAGVSGEAIAELSEETGQFLVPRGRYALELYPTFMRMLGKTYEFKVSYKSIARMFYLEKPTTVAGERSSRFFFVISLDDPIRHGAQRHPHLVMQLDRGSDDLVVPLRLSQEDIDAGRYEGLGKDGASELRGETPKLVAMLLKHVTGKPVFRPGAFMSSSDAKCVRASLKSSEGLLYPLDKSFLFIHKPTTYVRYAEVESVELQRSGGDTGGALASAARTFDLAVNCKALGSEPARTYLFSSVEKSEKDRLKTFLESRGLRVIENLPKGGKAVNLEELGDDEDDDEDEDDEDYDASKDKKKRKRGGDDSEEDDDDDDEGDGEDDEDEGFSRKKGKSSSKSSSSKSKRSKDSKKKPSSKKKSRRDDDDDDDDE